MKAVGSEEKPETSGTHEEEKESAVFGDLKADTPVPTSEATASVEENAKMPGIRVGSTDGKGKINDEKYDPEELVITADEKNAFIESMISGSRYKQTYSLFGDRVSITIRSRTNDETRAMYSYIRHELSNDSGNLSLVEGDMQYIMLIAQIDELNGTKFPEMKAPLTYTEDDGKTVPPGWISELEAWKKRPEGIIGALVNRVQLFEYKYWTMVREAANKNFWNSDTSTVA